MNKNFDWTIAAISPSQVEAVVRQARSERAEVMRAALAGLPAVFKQLVAFFRPRQAIPHKGALA